MREFGNVFQWNWILGCWVSEMIGCPARDPFNAFVNRVSQITGVVKRCGTLTLEMTNSVQIFHLGFQTGMKFNVDQRGS